MGKIVNPKGTVPELQARHLEILTSDDAKNLVESLRSVSTVAQEAYEDFNLHHIVDSAMQSLRLANKMLETHKPWNLVKKNQEVEAENELEAVLALGLESARIGALILYPFAPRLMSNLLDYLEVPKTARRWDNTGFMATGRPSDNWEKENVENLIFFRRIKN